MASEKKTISMKDTIEKELKIRNAGEITELLLDNCVSKEVVGLDGHQFPELANLSLSHCQLESLNGLPLLPALKTLDLSDNKLTDLALVAEKCPELAHLCLWGNPIDKVELLQPLTQIRGLRALELYDCPVAELETYRADVFQMFPSLIYLDSADVNNVEAGGDSDDGGEDDLDSVEDMGEDFESEDEEPCGLDYLNSSKVLEDDDPVDYKEASSKKRKIADATNGDVPAKKAAE